MYWRTIFLQSLPAILLLHVAMPCSTLCACLPCTVAPRLYHTLANCMYCGRNVTPRSRNRPASDALNSVTRKTLVSETLVGNCLLAIYIANGAQYCPQSMFTMIRAWADVSTDGPHEGHKQLFGDTLFKPDCDYLNAPSIRLLMDV